MVIKLARKTTHIERCNNTLRRLVSRLVREALPFSKKLVSHIGAIKLLATTIRQELWRRASITWIALPSPLLPGPDNPKLFHAKGQCRAVHAQAHRGPLGAREHPFGLLQRRQDQCPVTLFQRLRLPRLRARQGPGPGPHGVEWDL